MNAMTVPHRRSAAALPVLIAVGACFAGGAGAMQATPQQDLPSLAKQAEQQKAGKPHRRELDERVRPNQAQHGPPPVRAVTGEGRQQPPPPPARSSLSREQQEHLRIDRDRADRLRTQEHGPGQQREAQLQREKRLAQRRYEQEYYRRLHQQRIYWDAHRYDPYRDPYYYTAPVYRYRYDGRYYQTNRYGVHLMQLAVNFGYQEGLRAGIADREDGWAYDYRSNDAYRDASYGYYGYYLDQLQYRYYFREGFRRGYDDGYYRRYRYGRVADDGTYVVLAAILSAILGLQPL